MHVFSTASELRPCHPQSSLAQNGMFGSFHPPQKSPNGSSPGITSPEVPLSHLFAHRDWCRVSVLDSCRGAGPDSARDRSVRRSEDREAPWRPPRPTNPPQNGPSPCGSDAFCREKSSSSRNGLLRKDPHPVTASSSHSGGKPATKNMPKRTWGRLRSGAIGRGPP